MSNREDVSIEVFCRIRPSLYDNYVKCLSLNRQSIQLDKDKIKLITENDKEKSRSIVEKDKEKTFNFVRVLDETTTQDGVFVNCALDVVNWAIQGFNGSIFAYGQSGSGKTYTVCGNLRKQDEVGLVPRICAELLKRRDKDIDLDLTIRCSIVQCYFNKIWDLTQEKALAESLKICTVPQTAEERAAGKLPQTYVGGAQSIRIDSMEKFFKLFTTSLERRATSSTALNDVSTRSHVVVSFSIETKNTSSILHIVDLSGSERCEKAKTEGTERKEGNYINTSLLHLSVVVNQLLDRSKHIKYRNDSITFLLQNALGGNSRTRFIITVHDDLNHVEETLNSLHFSQRIQRIQRMVSINEVETPQKLKLRIGVLTKRIEELEALLISKDKEIKLMRDLLTANKIEIPVVLTKAILNQELNDDNDDDDTFDETQENKDVDDISSIHEDDDNDDDDTASIKSFASTTSSVRSLMTRSNSNNNNNSFPSLFKKISPAPFVRSMPILVDDTLTTRIAAMLALNEEVNRRFKSDEAKIKKLYTKMLRYKILSEKLLNKCKK